jgi:hypothetical protein
MSLYSEKHKIMFGADSIQISTWNGDLFIPSEVAIEPLTAAIP